MFKAGRLQDHVPNTPKNPENHFHKVSNILVQIIGYCTKEDLERQQKKLEEDALKQRQYWQIYKTKKKRVFGTISIADYQALTQRA